MLAVIAFTWLWLTGLGLVHKLIPGARGIEKAGLSFPLSAGIHGALLFVLMQAWKASVFWTCLLMSPLLLACARVRFKRPEWLGWKELLLVSWISLAGLQVFAHVVASPVVEWDALAMWIFKGKAIAVDGRISPQLLNWARYFNAFYPWNVPMMHAWLARFIGGFSENATVYVYMIYFLSLLLILYSLARLYFTRRTSLLFIALYLAIPSAVSITYNRDADAILATLIAAAMLLILRHQGAPGRGNAVLLGLTVFLICWTKIEGIVFCSILLLPYLTLLYGRARTASGRQLVAGSMAGCMTGLAAFWVPKQMFDVPTYLSAGLASFGGIAAALHKTAGIFLFAGRELLHLRNWNLLWLLPVILVIARRDRLCLKWLWTAHLTLYLIIYFVTPIDWQWQMITSFHRILFHTVPIMYAWAVVALSAEGERERSLGVFSTPRVCADRLDTVRITSG